MEETYLNIIIPDSSELTIKIRTKTSKKICIIETTSLSWFFILFKPPSNITLCNSYISMRPGGETNLNCASPYISCLYEEDLVIPSGCTEIQGTVTQLVLSREAWPHGGGFPALPSVPTRETIALNPPYPVQ